MIRSDIEDQDVVDNISHNAVYLNDRKVDTFDLCHQLPGYFIDSLTRGLSDNGLLEIAGIHVDVSSAATSCTEQFHASTLGHPFPGRHGQNLRRLRIHQARIDNDGGLALFLADLTQAKPLAKPARADFFVSKPNCVIVPMTMALTPRIFPIRAAVAGFTRSLT
jgi:hypothetical protein